MAFIEVNGVTLYYEDSGGTGNPIVFSHGLLFSARMFDAQVDALRGRYRCIAYDHRGQGKSECPRVRSHDVETLTTDAAALIHALGAAPCHFVGLSLGGFVGMRLAARQPELLRSLVLLETSADPEPPQNVPRYRLLTLIARLLGVRIVTPSVMRIVFGNTFRTDRSCAVERARWRGALQRNRRAIWRAVNGVIERAPIHDEIGSIRLPTLVAVGDEDVATPRPTAERIHARIPGSRLVVIPRAGHSSTVEQPEAVSREIGRFLDSVA